MKHYSRKKVSDSLFIISLLIIPLSNFIIFWLYVNFSSIMMAFQNKSGQFTMNNFVLFFEELRIPGSNITDAILNTIKFFLLNLCVIFPFSMIFSFFLYKKIFMYKYFRVVFFLPSIISVVILTSLYSYLIGSEGIISKIYSLFNPNKTMPIFLADSKYALNSILIYCLWTGFGVNLILFSGAMSRIPNSIIESAQLDGVGFFRELVSFTIPLIWPTVSTMITLTVVGMFTASGPILLFTQGNFNTFTIAYWIYDKVASYNNNFEYASAVGLIFTLLGMPLALITKKLLDKFDNDIAY